MNGCPCNWQMCALAAAGRHMHWFGSVVALVSGSHLTAQILPGKRSAAWPSSPGAPFTATPRGTQLLRLIIIVVANVGLEDKVGPGVYPILLATS
jgi:hypothetical protein